MFKLTISIPHTEHIIPPLLMAAAFTGGETMRATYSIGSDFGTLSARPFWSAAGTEKKKPYPFLNIHTA